MSGSLAGWEIAPLEGVGTLRFGMTPDEVHALLGAPRVSRPRPARDPATRPSLQELYVPGPGLTFEEAADAPGGLRLVAIGFGKATAELSYAGLKLFGVAPAEVLLRLAEDDPAPQEVAGTVVFVKLGLGLTGFHEGPPDDLAVSASAPGQWDRLAGRMTPFAIA